MQTLKCVVVTYISHTWYTYLVSTRVLLYTMFQNTCIHCFVWEETQCMSVSQSLWVPSSSVVSVLAYVTTTTTVPTLAWLSPLKRTKFASSRKNVSRVYRKTSRGWLAPLLCWWSSSWSSLRPSLVMSRGTSSSAWYSGRRGPWCCMPDPLGSSSHSGLQGIKKVANNYGCKSRLNGGC